MNIQPLLDWGYDFYNQYSLFCYVAGAVLLIALLWKPRKVLKGGVLTLVLALLVYLCYCLTSSINQGAGIKEKAIHRTEKAIGE